MQPRTYGFVYSGTVGVGVGVFRINDTELVGGDLAGGRYRGQVAEDASGEMTISLEMTVPAGMFLVQSPTPQDLEYIKSVTVKVPSEFGDGEPFKVEFPPGTVTLMVKRIPDDFAHYADGVIVEIRPIR